MEDTPNRRQRRLRRAFDGNRLQDQLLDLAYEQLWPQIRTALGEQMRDRLPELVAQVDAPFATLKGA